MRVIGFEKKNVLLICTSVYQQNTLIVIVSMSIVTACHDLELLT